MTKEEKFRKLSHKYKKELAPLISALNNLGTYNLIKFFSVWVTEYGDINGDEWSNEELMMNVLTENGVTEMKTPHIYVDISYGDYDNAETHDKIVELLGCDLYETTKGCEFYRLDWNELDEYVKAINDTNYYLDKLFHENMTRNITPKKDAFKTKGTIVPQTIFEEYGEDIRDLGMNYFTNFTEPSNDHYIIPMPKREVYGNLAERLVDGGYMEEEDLQKVFEKITECEVEISLKVTYTKTETLY